MNELEMENAKLKVENERLRNQLREFKERFDKIENILDKSLGKREE
jgi:hypothetical protein